MASAAPTISFSKALISRSTMEAMVGAGGGDCCGAGADGALFLCCAKNGHGKNEHCT
jgi:hypothetical protein